MSTRGEHVGTFEAKTKFAELLKRVEKGERITITRRGMPIAELVPVEKKPNRQQVREAIAALKKLRKGRSLEGVTIRQLIEEGRR